MFGNRLQIPNHFPIRYIVYAFMRIRAVSWFCNSVYDINIPNAAYMLAITDIHIPFYYSEAIMCTNNITTIRIVGL